MTMDGRRGWEMVKYKVRKATRDAADDKSEGALPEKQPLRCFSIQRRGIMK